MLYSFFSLSLIPNFPPTFALVFPPWKQVRECLNSHSDIFFWKSDLSSKIKSHLKLQLDTASVRDVKPYRSKCCDGNLSDRQARPPASLQCQHTVYNADSFVSKESCEIQYGCVVSYQIVTTYLFRVLHQTVTFLFKFIVVFLQRFNSFALLMLRFELSLATLQLHNKNE